MGFADRDKASRLDFADRQLQTRAQSRALCRASCLGHDDGVEDVYDVNIPGVNAFDANGFLAHNCGEQPLPPHGACLLGSINLARLVDKPFRAERRSTARLEALTATAVRFLDDAIDVSNYPLAGAEEGGQGQAPHRPRRHRARRRPDPVRRALRHARGGGAGRSMDGGHQAGGLSGQRRAGAREGRVSALRRGALPGGAECAAPAGGRARGDRRHGIRNGLLTSIAPTGTISLLAGNVSSGIEPVFDFRYERRVLERDGTRAPRR